MITKEDNLIKAIEAFNSLGVNVTWHKDVEQDFKSLPAIVKLDFLQNLNNIAIKPDLGKILENGYGLDLNNSYRIIYFNDNSRVIIYQISNNNDFRIWSIGRTNLSK